MTSDPSVVELTAAFARLPGLLPDTQVASTAVIQSAEVARDLIPLAVGAELTLVDANGVPTSTASTDRVVEAVDRMQYELGEGPCLSVWDTVSLQRVEDTLLAARQQQVPLLVMAVRLVHRADDPRL